MKNNLIELYRFIFILCICIGHFFANYNNILGIKINFFERGYLSVEFFFILSGFLFALKTDKSHNINIYDFIVSKIKRFYPIYFIGFLSSFIYYSVLYKSIILEPIRFLLEILMLSFLYAPINPPSWFLGVLIYLFPIMYIFINKYKKMFYFLSPYIIIIIYINILYQYEMLDVWWQKYGLVTIGVYRGIAGFLLGCIAYKISIILNRTNLNKLIIFIIEIVIFVFLLKMISFSNSNMNDFIIPILFAILIVTAFLPQIKWLTILNNKYISFLGNLTLSIFLNHWIVFQILFKHFSFLDLKYLIILYLFLIMIWSYLALKLSNFIFKRL